MLSVSIPMPPRLNTSEVGNIDKQIEQLMQCKPLSEIEVKLLCEKVTAQRAVPLL